MNSKTLSKSEIKELSALLEERYKTEPLTKKDRVLLCEGDIRHISINDSTDYFYSGDDIIPTIKNLLKKNFLKTVTVDMGAVKFVASGADIMRPGIVEIDEGIKKDDIVAVVDQANRKVLAVGRVLYSKEEMQQLTSGKCVKNLHHVGDDIWDLN